MKSYSCTFDLSDIYDARLGYHKWTITTPQNERKIKLSLIKEEESFKYLQSRCTNCIKGRQNHDLKKMYLKALLFGNTWLLGDRSKCKYFNHQLHDIWTKYRVTVFEGCCASVLFLSLFHFFACTGCSTTKLWDASFYPSVQPQQFGIQ